VQISFINNILFINVYTTSCFFIEGKIR